MDEDDYYRANTEENEILDDDYDDTKVSIRDIMTVKNVPNNIKQKQLLNLIAKKNYICDCKECLEFIPSRASPDICDSCSCSLIKHLANESDYGEEDSFDDCLYSEDDNDSS